MTYFELELEKLTNLGQGRAAKHSHPALAVSSVYRFLFLEEVSAIGTLCTVGTSLEYPIAPTPNCNLPAHSVARPQS